MIGKSISHTKNRIEEEMHMKFSTKRWGALEIEP